jgi:ATP-dependent RNA helicase RhlE
MKIKNSESGFAVLGLDPKLLSNLSRHGYIQPTPIQAGLIPPALQTKDLIGIAQTGTGKTLAFTAPIIHAFLNGEAGRALILAPTRELALQIEESFSLVGRPFGFRSAALIGGASMGKQIDQLKTKPHFIVATPGRLEDHMRSGRLSLRDIDIVVLDEADRMLDMGFLPAVQRIMAALPERKQVLLLSATMPNEIASLAERFMRHPETIQVQPAGTPIELIRQELIVVAKDNKNERLDEVLVSHKGTILVFARTRHAARKVAKTVRALGHSAAEIHSDRTMAQRREALDGFKRGKYRVLVATDIASRGIDVKNIEVVVNYDLPDNPEDYVHRIGRTGRAGESGLAITFALPEQARDVRNIEKLIRSQIPRGESSEPEVRAMPTRPAAHRTPPHRNRRKPPFGQPARPRRETTRR